MLPFRCHVETYQALRRQDATALAVLHAAKQSVAQEERGSSGRTGGCHGAVTGTQ